MSEYRMDGAAVISEKIPLATRIKEGASEAIPDLLRIHRPTIEMLAADMCRQNNPDANLTAAIKAGEQGLIRSLTTYKNGTPFDTHMKVYVIYELSRFLTRKITSPTEYLCDLLYCKPEQVIDKAVLRLCGQMPPDKADPTPYFQINHIRKAEPDTHICGGDAILFPCTGDFVITYNPDKIKDEADKTHAIWHELAHTLFYEYQGEHEVPEYKGWDWLGTKFQQQVEDICDKIAERVGWKRAA